MDRCKHGMDPRVCACCLGVDSVSIKEKRRKELEAKIEDDRILDFIAINSENYDEEWTEDEYYIFYRIFDSGRIKIWNRKALKEAVETLGRTRKSIHWKYLHMFILPDVPKAGRVLIRFRRMMGLSDDPFICESPDGMEYAY